VNAPLAGWSYLAKLGDAERPAKTNFQLKPAKTNQDQPGQLKEVSKTPQPARLNLVWF